MWRIFFLLCVFSTFSLATKSLPNRGKLILDQHPIEVQALVENRLLVLEKTRAISDFLTNVDLLEYEGFRLPKRKKAFMRHIKHVNEQLEWAFLTNQTVNDSIYELLYELTFFYQSYQKSAILEANVVKSRREKIQIYRTAKKSLRAFSYQKPVSEEPLAIETDSPFWHAVPDSMLVHQFDALAKQKKIKTKKRMIILFDGLSYSGSAPKVKTLDLDYDNEWSLKWGDEVHTDVLGSRIFAALGYDVDHPYYYGKDKLTLVFPQNQTVKNATQLIDSIYAIYSVNLRPFITNHVNEKRPIKFSASNVPLPIRIRPPQARPINIFLRINTFFKRNCFPIIVKLSE